MFSRGGGGRSGSGVIRIVIAVGIAAFSACAYYSNTSVNPVTGETQHVDLNPQQEIALGLQSAPEMAQQFGGEDPDRAAQALVQEVGQRVVAGSEASRSPYRFQFHLLADRRTVNAFALPGGQIFITRALFSKLKDKAMLAGVLGHEAGHVVARHSAQQMAKAKLTQGLAGAATVATTDPNDPRTYKNAAITQAVAGLISLKFSRNDELQADALGVRYMAEAGYDPRALIGVMDVLEASSGGGGGPEFAQTHPNPGNRREHIKEEIAKLRNGTLSPAGK